MNRSRLLLAHPSRPGVFPSQATRLGEIFHSDLLRRAVSAVQTFDRVRALTKVD